MKTQYIIRGYHAFSEQDNFEQGCIGATKYENLYPQDWTIKANTLKELLQILSDEFKSEDFLLDSCEEVGRIDLQANQLKPFETHKLSEQSIAKWKAGEIDTWLTCYSFNVEKVVTGFSIIDEMAKEQQ